MGLRCGPRGGSISASTREDRQWLKRGTQQIGRRGFLTAGSMAVIGLAAGGVGAQQAEKAPAPAPKGPPVWRDLDQTALDKAYDQGAYAPNLAQIVKRYGTNSEAARKRLGEPRHLFYGPAPIERIEWFATPKSNAPVQIFVHGGAWRSGLAKEYAFLAELFVASGAHFAAIDFSTVLEVDGNLVPMADQVRRAIRHLHGQAKNLGADAERFYLSGHSSGAHLAGVALTTDWAKTHALPANVIKGGLCCSGLYDLKPVRLSARSRYVTFTDAMEEAMSPQRHLGRLNAPLILAYGTLETPEFQRQTRDFAAAVGALGKPVELLVGEGYNHFEILETLASPYGLLGRAALKQMGLAPA